MPISYKNYGRNSKLRKGIVKAFKASASIIKTLTTNGDREKDLVSFSEH